MVYLIALPCFRPRLISSDPGDGTRRTLTRLVTHRHPYGPVRWSRRHDLLGTRVAGSRRQSDVVKKGIGLAVALTILKKWESDGRVRRAMLPLRDQKGRYMAWVDCASWTEEDVSGKDLRYIIGRRMKEELLSCEYNTEEASQISPQEQDITQHDEIKSPTPLPTQNRLPQNRTGSLLHRDPEPPILNRAANLLDVKPTLRNHRVPGRAPRLPIIRKPLAHT